MLREFGLVIAISFLFACSDAPDTIKPTPAGAGGNAAAAGKAGTDATAGKGGSAAAGKGGSAAAGKGGAAAAGRGGAAAAGKGGGGGSSDEDLDAGTDVADGATDGGDAAAP